MAAGVLSNAELVQLDSWPAAEQRDVGGQPVPPAAGRLCQRGVHRAGPPDGVADHEDRVGACGNRSLRSGAMRTSDVRRLTASGAFRWPPPLRFQVMSRTGSTVAEPSRPSLSLSRACPASCYALRPGVRVSVRLSQRLEGHLTTVTSSSLRACRVPFRNGTR